ncbi:ATP-dependent DNA helicase [Trichonephila clavata]|uniref:ATP-dependent DNA helicase n=1 Tax=Trichonephila clavata TaxID=2740835 RepID=A0A8X6JK66_TRICU|nr:ATP-dependent DNA helicase [Trichonephila clavata]
MNLKRAPERTNWKKRSPQSSLQYGKSANRRAPENANWKKRTAPPSLQSKPNIKGRSKQGRAEQDPVGGKERSQQQQAERSEQGPTTYAAEWTSGDRGFLQQRRLQPVCQKKQPKNSQRRSRSDMAVFDVTRSDGNAHNEIYQYEMGRCISSHEAVWRILNFLIHERYPTVIHLSVHLENGQRVYFTEGNAAERA